MSGASTGAGPVAGFLGYLPDRERETLLALGYERAFAAGKHLMLQGDPPAHVLIVLEGQVKVVFESGGNEALLLALRGPGDVLGELAALAGPDGRRTASIEAMDDVRARVIGVPAFMDYLERHPRAALALLRDVRDRLRHAEHLRFEAVNLDVTTRVTRQLAELGARYGRPTSDGHIRLRVSQSELAGWVGASRKSVERAITSLRRRDLIASGYRSIDIIELDCLKAAAGLS